MTEPRLFPAQEERVESGPIQFGDDWPGIFMRGDHALPAAFYLKLFLDQHPLKEGDDPITRHYVEALMRDLSGCDATGVTKNAIGNGGW